MRLIDVDALVEKIGKEIDEAKKAPLSDYCAGMKNVIGIVKNQDSVDPVKHGHWEIYEGQSNTRVACSECEHPVNYFWDDWKSANYCPNCGAKMDGEAE